MCKVSIIVPVYNCDAYIGRCISSICGQTYGDIQIIIVDDGSTDKSPDIIDGFSDERLVIIHQENSGVCVARNNGIASAGGEYITFIDGDDYVEPDYIEKLVRCATDNGSELVISGFLFEKTGGIIKDALIPQSYRKGYDEIWAYRLSSACGRLYSRSFWEKNRLKFTLQERVRGEDVPICLFANYAAKNIAVVNYAGYHYVQHAGSATHEYVGLKKYGFPYEAMDELAEKIPAIDEHNSREFFEAGVLKLFAQFYYYMGWGADRKVKKEMFKRFAAFIECNCPGYRSSWRYVKNHSKLPAAIYGAIELFILRLLLKSKNTENK